MKTFTTSGPWHRPRPVTSPSWAVGYPPPSRAPCAPRSCPTSWHDSSTLPRRRLLNTRPTTPSCPCPPSPPPPPVPRRRRIRRGRTNTTVTYCNTASPRPRTRPPRRRGTPPPPRRETAAEAFSPLPRRRRHRRISSSLLRIRDLFQWRLSVRTAQRPRPYQCES